jgi:hypothetical protein
MKMKISDEYISRYLDGELTPEEEASLKKKMEESKELRARYNFLKELGGAVKEEEIMDFRNQVNKIVRNKSKQRKNYEVKKLIPVAASLLAIIIIAIFVIVDRPDENKDVFSNYYEPYPLTINTRDAGDNTHKLLASEAYENRNWSEAEKEFEYLTKKNQDKHLFNLYLAITKIELDKNVEAKIILLDLLKEDNLLIRDQVYWYLSLLYLKTKNYKKAIGIFNIIIQKDMYYSDKAKDILKKIEKEK